MESKYTVRNIKAKDIFIMSKILKKMDIKGKFSMKDKSQAEFGQEFFITLLEQLGEAEQEFYVFFGSLIGEEAKVVEELDLDELMDIFEQFKNIGGMKRFFIITQIGIFAHHYRILDLVMSRYSDMSYFDNLDFEDGVELIKEALEQQKEQKSWELYLTRYPNMDEKTFIPFDKFYKRSDEIKFENSNERKLQKEVDKKKYITDAVSLAEKIKKAHQTRKDEAIVFEAPIE